MRKTPKLNVQRTELSLREGKLRLAVVADTHSEPHPRTAELVMAARPDAILHAGDIGNLEVIAGLKKIAPTYAVRGNIDVHAADLPDHLTIALLEEGGEPLFRILLTHIAVNGPKLRADALRRAKAEEAELVICGHSHVPFIGRDRDLMIFNPGSIGPRRFHLPIVFGVMDVMEGRKLSMKHVSCETGERWLP